jgi:hypothetical protein
MRRIPFLFILVLWSTGVVKAQIVQKGCKSHEMKGLKEGTLLVAAMPKDKRSVRIALTKYWKQCKFEFISDSIENHLHNPKIYVLNIYNGKFGLFCGDKRKLSSYLAGDYMMLMDQPFPDDVPASADYMIKSMNDAIDLVMNKKIHHGRMPVRTGHAISVDAPKVKEKTLLIISEYSDKKGTDACILSDAIDDCKMKHKVVSERDAKKLMISGDKNYCLLSYKVYANGDFVTFIKEAYIYDFETQKVVYAYFRKAKTPYSAFRSRDFRRMDRAVRK